MRKYLISLIFICLFTSLNACSLINTNELKPKYSKIDEIELSNEALVAKKYLETKGYHVIAFSETTSSSYILTVDMLNDQQDKYEGYKWSLQDAPTKDFIGKKIFNERFIVNNHPLDNWESGSIVSEGKTYADVIIVDGIAVGGISAPYTKEAIVGMPFSLDGKSLDEIEQK